MRLNPLAALMMGLTVSAGVHAASPLSALSQVGGNYFHATTGGFNAEIAAFDALTGTLWVSGVTGVDVLNITPGGLTFNSRIDLSSYGAINSI
ncbi:MAG: hypothetical protein LDL16_04380 [Thiobacillus sp.]|nr:hypothetical protein [Thiobacillus sp.]